MNIRMNRLVLATCLAVATATTALAQTPAALVVTGNDWMTASYKERQAFLVGVANMIIAETAGAKSTDRAVPLVSSGITRRVANLDLPQIEARITAWYQANPGRMGTPVMTVIWQNFAAG